LYRPPEHKTLSHPAKMGNRLRMFGVWSIIDQPSRLPAMACDCPRTGCIEVDDSPTPHIGEWLPTRGLNALGHNATGNRRPAACSEAIQGWLMYPRVGASSVAQGVRNRNQDGTTPARTCCEVSLHRGGALRFPSHVVPPIRRGQAAPQTQSVDSHRGAMPRVVANRVSSCRKGMAR